MMIYPAVHYTMGGLWVDYNLMSTIPGCFVLGEANFSDHGANRLGASALMQGLADGYFVIPYTIGGYLVGTQLPPVNTSLPQFKDAEGVAKERIKKLMRVKGKKTVEAFHRELGHIMWEYVGMGRTDEGLKKAKQLIPALRAEYWDNVKIPGGADGFNQSLDRAIRVADFLEFAELLVVDAMNRRESCGGHFNEAFQTEEGEALRDDQNMAHAAVWEYAGEGKEPILNKEPLVFENVKLAVRSYK
jgi:succinate dehydrogenase / fumarate reductase flavoprotein subunit